MSWPKLSHWTRLDYPALPSARVVRYRGVAPFWSRCEVNASAQGVNLLGSWPVMDAAMLEEFRQVLKLAEEQQKLLARDLFITPGEDGVEYREA